MAITGRQHVEKPCIQGLFDHFLADLPRGLVFQDDLLCTVVCHLLFYQVVFAVIFRKMTVFSDAGLSAPDIELDGLP